MSPTKKVKKLTPAQEALIPVYREKWRARSLSTFGDRSHAVEMIKVGACAIGIYRIGCHFVRSYLSRTCSH
ncbi:hypothetical protein QT995_19660 [Microcoleus sp. S36b_A3]|uniref:hypothetical protein n=1 Tax=unclassified Microcoleus TaxID=2642155 RepID=UPI002FCFDD84